MFLKDIILCFLKTLIPLKNVINLVIEFVSPVLMRDVCIIIATATGRTKVIANICFIK